MPLDSIEDIEDIDAIDAIEVVTRGRCPQGHRHPDGFWYQ